MARALAAIVLVAPILAQTIRLPNVLYNDTVVAEAVAKAGNLDGHKLNPSANETSYDWWYFDAVSTASRNESVTVVFFETGPLGFINDYLGGPLSVYVWASFENGTLFSTQVPVNGSAIIKMTDDDISGDWEGSGFKFEGTGLDGSRSKYVVTVDNPAVGIYGTITLKSVAPPHYPCGPDKPGQTEQLMPHVFWANQQPDAVAAVDLTIRGSRVRFSDGVGYHDKNWGDVPFVAAVQSWYWGHARIGPYSVVFFDALTHGGDEYLSSYVVRGGRVVESSCAPGSSVVVRPWGRNSEYPPQVTSGTPDGLAAVFDLGGDKGGKLAVNFTNELAVQDAAVYQRFIGLARGCHDRTGQCWEGRTVFEQFKFPPPE